MISPLQPYIAVTAPYTTPAAMAAYLGVTFTTEQTDLATDVAAAVTVWIDHRTGRSWQAGATVSGELHQTVGQTVYLTNTPVTAVTTVELKPNGNNPYATVDPADYALVDAQHGELVIYTAANNQQARVAYTYPAAGPPADIALACTVLASDLMYQTLHPESHGLSQLSLGQADISMQFAGTSGTTSSAAQMAVGIVDSYRKVVLA